MRKGIRHLLLAAALTPSPLAAASGSAIDGPELDVEINIELAGADETDRVSDKELRDADQPMVPAVRAKPTTEEKQPETTVKTEPAPAAAEPQPIPAAAPPAEKPVMAASPMLADGAYLRLGVGGGLSHAPDGQGRNGNFRDTDGGIFALIDGGAGIRVAEAFRVEGEIGYRTDIDIDGTDGAGRETDTDVSTQTGLIQVFYDFAAARDYLGSGGVVPYVGAGLGLARLATGDQTTSAGQPSEGGDEIYNFAYALMAGMSVGLGQRIDADLGYRFVNLGDFRQDGGFSDGTTAAATTYDDLLVHEVRFGLRYRF